jgi:hypothetical protein
MQRIKYVHWQENISKLGYIEEYPDYWTLGDTLANLVEHLKDLYLDLSGGHLTSTRIDLFKLRSFCGIVIARACQSEEYGQKSLA